MILIPISPRACLIEDEARDPRDVEDLGELRDRGRAVIFPPSGGANSDG
jgi:hypothetical protein